MPSSQFFKNVTLLITHYNRSKSLQRLLQTLTDLECLFEDIVVSDDCSNETHLSAVKELQRIFTFRLITSPVNKGLANNINKGQAAVTTPLTLYIQEDFIPCEKFSKTLSDAISFLDDRVDLDIIRFYAYRKYPYLLPFKNGFSEMFIKPWHANYYKVHYYSDHPHLRRSSFLEKFGEYQEGIKSDRAEYRMCLSFIQKKGKGLFFDEYQSLFIQDNPVTEPSTVSRKNWTTSSNPIVAIVRYFYRQLKFNYDINFFKHPKKKI